MGSLGLLSILMTACVTSHSAPTGQFRSELQTIADKQAPMTEVIAAMAKLGPAGESSAFWATIANDTSYERKRRGLCAMELFKRHVQKGMTLEEVAKVLAKPDWLPDRDIIRIWGDIIMGSYPIAPNDKDTLFVLAILPPKNRQLWCVCLSVEGKHIDSRQLGMALRGESGGASVAQRKVRAVACPELWRIFDHIDKI